MHDVILVGAGTAGCVLAERLTRSRRLNVLRLEACGRPSSPFVRVPAWFVKPFRSLRDWALEIDPQGAAGRHVFIPRGRMLGGSANMNAQIRQWRHPADFEGWARCSSRRTAMRTRCRPFSSTPTGSPPNCAEAPRGTRR